MFMSDSVDMGTIWSVDAQEHMGEGQERVDEHEHFGHTVFHAWDFALTVESVLPKQQSRQRRNLLADDGRTDHGGHGRQVRERVSPEDGDKGARLVIFVDRRDILGEAIRYQGQFESMRDNIEKIPLADSL